MASPSAEPAVADAARTLADELGSLEWELHGAVRRGEEADARGVAAAGADLIAAYREAQARSDWPDCLNDAKLAIEEFLSAEQRRWQAWSEGNRFPTRDEIDLFYALYGVEEPWILALADAEALCGRSASARSP